MKRACTILLRAKKVKKFISLPHKGLRYFTKFFTPDFRMKRASLCKGGGATLFAPKGNRLKINDRPKTMKTRTYNLIRCMLPRYTLHSSRFTFLARPRRTRKYPFMQNEPNFQFSRSKLNAVIAETYNKYPSWKSAKTNPVEPNRTQFHKPAATNLAIPVMGGYNLGRP